MTCNMCERKCDIVACQLEMKEFIDSLKKENEKLKKENENINKENLKNNECNIRIDYEIEYSRKVEEVIKQNEIIAKYEKVIALLGEITFLKNNL